MQNKISLIIPDLHHRWYQAERIISSVGADEVIFLGDYFDDFNDTPEMVRETCDWLENSVKKPNRVHLFGNHDQHYAFPYKTFQCSGYAQWKYFIIHDTLPREVWDKLKWYHFLDNRWMLSHAGLHKLNVPESILSKRNDRQVFIKELSEWLDHEIRLGFQNGAKGNGSWIFNAGHARWGSQRVGGITWCDYQREFNPFKGMNQIMGHTPTDKGKPWHWTRIAPDGNVLHPQYKDWHPTPEQLDNPELSTNICLDVYGNTHWGVWNGRRLEIGNYKDL